MRRTCSRFIPAMAGILLVLSGAADSEESGRATPPAGPAPPAASSAGPNLLSEKPQWPMSAPLTVLDSTKGVRTLTIRPVEPDQAERAATGYFVDLGTETSVADGRALYERLRRRFPDLLAARQALIRPVTAYGETYHHVLVGPFEDDTAARELCAELQAAGGVCIVQKR